MITLVTGENDYELTKKVAQISAEFDGTAERVDAADLTKEGIADIFAGQTLFAINRMIIIDSPSLNSDLWQNISDWAGRLSDSTTLILLEPKPDKRTAAYKWLKKHADVLEFKAYGDRDTRELIRWLESYASKQSVDLTALQIRRLIDRAGPNQWELAHAIDKLALIDKITDEWLDNVTEPNVTDNVFALFDLTLNGQLEKIQTAIINLRQTEDPYRILGLINSQAMQLAVLTYGEGNASKVAADTGASSAYPYQKLAPFALRVSKADVRSIVEMLAEADIRIKSSDADPWLVLESTLIRIASLMSA